MLDQGAARIGVRRWAVALCGGLLLTVLTAGSTQLADFAPYAPSPALQPGDTEAIPMVAPPLTGLRHAAYRLFDPTRRQDEIAAHHTQMVTSVCLTGQDATMHRLVVCSIRNPAPLPAAVLKLGRVGRIR